MIKLKTWAKVLIAFSKRISRFSIDLTIILFNLIYNLIIYRRPYQNDIIFVTAAEKNYFKQLDSLLESYYKYLRNELIVYDIGLEYDHIKYLENKYNNLIVKIYI